LRSTYIVFATCADALRQEVSILEPPLPEQTPNHLLSINCALELRKFLGLANCSQEDGLELVHARVGEQQGGVIVRHDRRRGDCIDEKRIVSRVQRIAVELFASSSAS